MTPTRLAAALIGATLAAAPAAQAGTRSRLDLATGHTLPAAAPLTAHAPLSAGTATPTLNQPLGLALDRAGNLYVANVNAGITIYNPAHQLIGRITSGVSLPTAVGVSFQNNSIYVANEGTQNVTIYNQSYTQTGTITDPALGAPSSLYIDGNDAIWVLDYSGNLHLYLDNGTPVGASHTGGSAVGPWGSYWSVWGVADSGGYDEFYQNTGEALHYGVGAPSYFPGGSPQAGGEAEDAAGDQYVTDQANSRVIEISPNGEQFLAFIAMPSLPYGIAVDEVNRKFYVSFPQTYQIGVYSLKPPFKHLATIR